jgi:hypothetical protein
MWPPRVVARFIAVDHLKAVNARGWPIGDRRENAMGCEFNLDLWIVNRPPGRVRPDTYFRPTCPAEHETSELETEASQDAGDVEVSQTALLSQEGSTIETAVEIVRGVVPEPHSLKECIPKHFD